MWQLSGNGSQQWRDVSESRKRPILITCVTATTLQLHVLTGATFARIVLYAATACHVITCTTALASSEIDDAECTIELILLAIEQNFQVQITAQVFRRVSPVHCLHQ